jgi:tRNA A-37 threonylcarbamoyl transferase component Bud32
MSNAKLQSEELLVEDRLVEGHMGDELVQNILPQNQLLTNELLRLDAESNTAGTLLSGSAEASELLEAGDEIKLDPLALAKARIQALLTKNNFAIFAFISLGLLSFQAVFGRLALVAVLLCGSISYILAASSRMSSRFFISCDQSGILVKKKDFFGTHWLKIPWTRIDSILERESKDSSQKTLLLQLKKNALSVPNAFIFTDLLQDQHQMKIDGWNCGDYTLLRNSLLSNCPSELVKISDESVLKVDNSSLIEYRPFRKERQFASVFLRKCESPFITILSVLLLCSFFTFGGHISFILLIGVLVPLLMLVLLLKEKAIQFACRDNGLSIVWKSCGQGASRLIPWELVQSVNSRQRKTIKGAASEIVLTVNTRDARTAHLNILSFLAPALFKRQLSSVQLVINLDDLADENERQKLLKVIHEKCNQECIDKSVADLLNPTDTASYTKLWMDSLIKEVGSRRLEGKLASGHFLRNGQFEIIRLLGSGGQANAYLAAINGTEEQVVLKEFILPSHAGADISLRSLEHIEKELSLMKKIEHQNIVRYYDIFVEDHRCYLVLEHINGKSLRELVENNGALDQSLVKDLALQMANILAHLHSQNPPLVHRDFTPENLILDENGILKLIDFNVAQELEEGSTRTIVGKHAYLPPEQFRGKACPQSDIYAYGATLHYLLTGEEPEPISCSHPILINEAILPEFEKIVSQATELELADRTRDAQELIESLKVFKQEESAPV